MTDLLLTCFYLLCAAAVATLIARSYQAERFSFHLIFSGLYFVTFFGGFPLSMALKYGFDVSVQRPEVLFETLAVATGSYFLYVLSYRFFDIRVQGGTTRSGVLNGSAFAKNSANVIACLLALLAIVSLAGFIYFNGFLLLRLEKYSQIFSPLVSGVALKRFFYFLFPALLIAYFLAPSRRMWWGLLPVGMIFGGLSYFAVGGTRANLALAVMFFLLIGWKDRYLSAKTVVVVAIFGVVAMFGLALARYNLDVQGKEAIFTFLYLTRDSFSPWENFARILATDVEFQGLMPIVRDFYVYIPPSLWADRPDIAWNTANYFTKELLGNHSGLAMSPTLLGSLYLMGSLPLVAVGMGLIGKLLAETDRLFRSASPLWQGYLLANLFNLIVLVREGADAFISRWCFFTAVFLACWGLAYILVGKRNG